MPTHRPRIAELTTSELAYIARRKPGSIRRQLEEAGLAPARADGRTLWWSARAAFAVLAGRRDTTAERARLDRARAEAQELKNARDRGELVPAEDQDRVVIALATTVSARLQGIASRLAPRLAAADTAAACRELVDAAIRSALEDLADAGRDAQARADAA